VTLVAAVAYSGPAFAHAERASSRPDAGSKAATAPGSLVVTFTEPPTGDAAVEVLDGCGRDVVSDVQVQNYEITATLAAGQPGRWEVRTNVISAIDGHNTRDRWAFSVRGEADCSAAETPAPEATEADDEDEGGGGALPLIAIGAATLVLVAVGMMLRGRGS
jgi:methionine-rich copper-binding protein CopC